MDKKDCNCQSYDPPAGPTVATSSDDDGSQVVQSVNTPTVGKVLDLGRYRVRRDRQEFNRHMTMIALVVAAFLVGYFIATVEME